MYSSSSLFINSQVEGAEICFIPQSLFAKVIFRTDAVAMEQMQNSSSAVQEDENFIKDIDLLQNVHF